MKGKPAVFRIVFPDKNSDFPWPMNPQAEIHARYDGTYYRMLPSFTETELDPKINYLIEELEAIRLEGKRIFTKEKEIIKAAKKKIKS